MGLFDVETSNPSLGFITFRDAVPGGDAHIIQATLETMWAKYEHYADGNFRSAFAADVDPGFWEMYLALVMLGGRKKLRERSELTKAQRDKGPDLCIRKGNRRIWIEAMSPDRGNEVPGVPNPDRVQELKLGLNDPKDNPRRQIELRIRGALLEKAKKFASYRATGLVDEKDSCIVAISGGQFMLEAAGQFLPHPISAVYPFGKEVTTLDPNSGRLWTRFEFSADIEFKKPAKPGEPPRENPVRGVFQSKQYKDISGLIWSLRSVGSFAGQPHDLLYLHNQAAERPIPRRWFDWANEYFPSDDGKQLIRKQNREQQRVAKKERALLNRLKQRQRTS